MCVNDRKKLNQLHSVLSNRDINLCVSVVRPSIEHGSVVWDCNKNQASAIILSGANKIFGCSSNM